MNSHDFFRKMVGMVDSVEQGKEPAQLNEAKGQFRAGSKSYFKAGQQAIKNMKADAKAKKEKEEKDKASNVKESGAEFFRKYSDIIKEAEEMVDEDESMDDGADELEEGKIDDMKDAKAAKDEADADDYSKAPKEKKGTVARKVQGKQYGGSKQKDEVEESVAKKKMIGR